MVGAKILHHVGYSDEFVSLPNDALLKVQSCCAQPAKESLLKLLDGSYVDKGSNSTIILAQNLVNLSALVEARAPLEDLEAHNNSITQLLGHLLFQRNCPKKQRFLAYKFIAAKVDTSKFVAQVVLDCWKGHVAEVAREALAGSELDRELELLTSVLKWRLMQSVLNSSKDCTEKLLYNLVVRELESGGRAFDDGPSITASASLQDDITLNKILKLMHLLGELYPLSVELVELMCQLCSDARLNAQSKTLAGLVYFQSPSFGDNPALHFFHRFGEVHTDSSTTETKLYGYLSLIKGMLTSATSSKNKASVFRFGPHFARIFSILIRLEPYFYTTFGRNVYYSTVLLSLGLLYELVILQSESSGGTASYVTKSQVEEYVNCVFTLVRRNWEDPVEGTQYKMQDLFVVLNQLAKFLQGSNIYAKDGEQYWLSLLLDPVLSLDRSVKLKYQLLSLITDNWPTETVLKKAPELLSIICDGFALRSTSGGAGNALKRYLGNLKVFYCNKTELWSQAWVPALFKVLQDRSLAENLCAFALEKIAHTDPSALLHLLNAAAERLDLNQLSNLKLVMRCLMEQVRKYPRTVLNESLFSYNKWHWLIASASCHSDCKVAVQAFQLHCDILNMVKWNRVERQSLKVSFNGVLNFVKNNLACSSNEGRYEVEAVLNSLLTRICTQVDSIEQSKSRETSGQARVYVDVCNEFLNGLVQTLICNQRPGASFAREALSLSLLELVSSVFGLNVERVRNIVINCPPHMMLQIVQTVQSPYESNRSKLVKILQNYDPKELPPKIVAKLASSALLLANNIRAHEADAGGRLLAILLCISLTPLSNRKEKAGLQRAVLSSVSPQCTATHAEVIGCKEDYLLLLLRGLNDRWSDEIAVAQSDLHTAANRGLLHGQCMLLAHVAGSIDFHKVFQQLDSESKLSDWSRLFVNILANVSSVCKIVLHVISDESPEGKDFTFDDQDGAVDSGSVKLLLHFGFRSAKEASNLLSFLFKSLPLSGRVIDGKILYFVPTDFVKGSGDLLQTLLLCVRHRGAFQTIDRALGVVVGRLFCMQPCSTPETIRDTRLKNLPSEWLEATLVKIAGAGIEDLCYTRRSAGLPYLILAIVTNYRDLLPRAVERLFQIVDQVIESEGASCGGSLTEGGSHTALPAVHALNILRILFGESSLVKLLSSYLPRALKLIVEAFSSRFYGIRNAAMTLFSEVLSRAVGAESRTVFDSSSDPFALSHDMSSNGGDTSGTNGSITGRELFKRHPSLLNLLKDSLERFFGENGSCSVRANPQVYPILVMISRLKPVNNELDGEQCGVEELGALVRSCAKSSSWPVRTIAARALLPLVPSKSHYQIACEILEFPDACDSDAVHGGLLQVNFLLHSCNGESADTLCERLFGIWERGLLSNDFCYQLFLQICEVYMSWRLPQSAACVEKMSGIVDSVYENLRQNLVAGSQCTDYVFQASSSKFLSRFPHYRTETFELVLAHGCEESKSAVLRLMSQRDLTFNFMANFGQQLMEATTALRSHLFAFWARVQMEETNAPIFMFGNSTDDGWLQTLCKLRELHDSGLVHNDTAVYFFQIMGVAVGRSCQKSLARIEIELFEKLAVSYGSESSSEEHRNAVLEGLFNLLQYGEPSVLTPVLYSVICDFLQDDSAELRLKCTELVSKLIQKSTLSVNPIKNLVLLYTEIEHDVQFFYKRLFGRWFSSIEQIPDYCRNVLLNVQEDDTVLFAKEDPNCYKEALVDAQLCSLMLSQIKSLDSTVLQSLFTTLLQSLQALNLASLHSKEFCTWMFSKFADGKLVTLQMQLLLLSKGLSAKLDASQMEKVRATIATWKKYPLHPLVLETLSGLCDDATIQRDSIETIFLVPF